MGLIPSSLLTFSANASLPTAIASDQRRPLEFPNFEAPPFVSLNDLNEAKRLNGWNDWNWLRL
jgi:hypothetical protein